VYQGAIYVGGTDSGLYKYDLPSSITPPSSVIDTTAPMVTISQPANGTSVSRKTNISAKGTDDGVVVKMEVIIDGRLATTINGSSVNYAWNSQKISSGPHAITVKAYDASGKTGQSSVSVQK
jgi:hypothetical protein